MSNDHAGLVAKVWNYAHVLRDAGVSEGEYVEQITCLLFLKMDQERANSLNQPSVIPPQRRWARLRTLTGEKLSEAYAAALAAMAIPETERNIANKIAWGGFTAVFFVQCLMAAGCQTVRLVDD
jgi:hypothetical protein